MNNNKCWCGCKKHNACWRDYIWNPARRICEEEKYLISIIDDSKIICDEVIKSYKEEINCSNKC